MRFKRWMRVQPYDDTTRKRAAFHRTMRMRREKLPLFADMVAETQPDVDTEMARRAIAWVDDQQSRRDHHARNWRRARAAVAALNPNLRPIVRALWNDAPYPADPVYLLTLLHSIDVGRVDPSDPPWRPVGGHKFFPKRMDAAKPIV